MKSVLVIGLGAFGKNLVMQLYSLGHQVMAVDVNEERVNECMPYVTNARIGDGTNEVFLESLEIEDYDVCFVAIENDFQNSLEATSLLADLGAQLVVSRAERDVHAKFLLRNGANEVICPETQMAKWAAFRYTADHVYDYVQIDENHAIYEVEVPKQWRGLTVGAIDIRRKYQINILGIKRNGKLDMIITPETELTGDETMLVLGEYKSLQKYFRV